MVKSNKSKMLNILQIINKINSITKIIKIIIKIIETNNNNNSKMILMMNLKKKMYGSVHLKVKRMKMNNTTKATLKINKIKLWMKKNL